MRGQILLEEGGGGRGGGGKGSRHSGPDIAPSSSAYTMCIYKCICTNAADWTAAPQCPSRLKRAAFLDRLQYPCWEVCHEGRAGSRGRVQDPCQQIHHEAGIGCGAIHAIEKFPEMYRSSRGTLLQARQGLNTVLGASSCRPDRIQVSPNLEACSFRMAVQCIISYQHCGCRLTDAAGCTLEHWLLDRVEICHEGKTGSRSCYTKRPALLEMAVQYIISCRHCGSRDKCLGAYVCIDSFCWFWLQEDRRCWLRIGALAARQGPMLP